MQRTINPYSDSSVPQVSGVDNYGRDQLTNLQEISTGQGSKAYRVDRDGMWLGAQKFADAPWSVDMQGQMRARNAIFQNSEGAVFIDANGLISVSNFDSDDQDSGSFLNQVIGTTEEDFIASTKTFTLRRTTKVLCIADFVTFSGGVGVYSGNGVVRMRVDGGEANRAVISFTNVFNGSLTSSIHSLLTLGPGNHELKLTGELDILGGAPTFTIYKYYMSYIKLGS